MNLTRRVLLVTSSYAPTVIADMHRVRQLAWELPPLGWDVEILAPGSDFQRREYFEPDSAYLFNSVVPVHYVTPDDRWLIRTLKMRSIGWRALRPMREAGDRLLSTARFDLVYISTGNFSLFCLGRGWARQHGVPYVLDFHDPWVRKRIDYRTTTNRLKRRVAAALSRHMERYAVRRAAGIVAVSPLYLDELRERHGKCLGLQPHRCEAIPFGASERDFPIDSLPVESRCGADREVIYVGAGGAIMAKSFETICAALVQIRQASPDLIAGFKIRLFGTYAYWRPGEPRPLFEIACRHGLQDLVSEEPARISYAEAMRRARAADGVIVLGVDDAGYMPSKLFSYALTGRPLLACFRSDSPMRKLFQKLPELGHSMIFDATSAAPESNAVGDAIAFLREVVSCHRFDRRELVKDYLALAMARKHASLFNRIVRNQNGR